MVPCSLDTVAHWQRPLIPMIKFLNRTVTYSCIPKEVCFFPTSQDWKKAEPARNTSRISFFQQHKGVTF